MLARQHPIATVAAELGIRAATDVTGFGLAGHLIEMLEASQVGAMVRLQSIPALPGAIELVQMGVESSLTPENMVAQSEMNVAPPLCDWVTRGADNLSKRSRRESSTSAANVGYDGSDVLARGASRSHDETFVDAQQAKYRLLFDPQTCGGLLLGLPENQKQRFLGGVSAKGLECPVEIGRVIQRGSTCRVLTVA